MVNLSYLRIKPDGSVFLSYNSKDYFMGDLLTQEVENIWGNAMYDKRNHNVQASWLEDEVSSKSVVVSRMKNESGITGGGVL